MANNTKYMLDPELKDVNASQKATTIHILYWVFLIYMVCHIMTGTLESGYCGGLLCHRALYALQTQPAQRHFCHANPVALVRPQL